MTSTQKPDLAKVTSALLDVCHAVRDTVQVSGTLGVPGGTLYAALMTQGCTLEQFEIIMDVLVKAGKVTKRGDLYFATEAK